MTRIKIGVVEDELIIARNIISTLEICGYSYCGPAISYTEAIKMLKEEKPDLLLLDINLSGKKDGLDVAAYLNENNPIPFILLTAISDTQTVERAKKVKPHAYIVKPYTKEELFAAIEIAISNFSEVTKSLHNEERIVYNNKDAVFVKNGYQFHKVQFTDILYIESVHNNLSLFLSNNQQIVIRSCFYEFLLRLPVNLFMQVHRSFAINLLHVDALDSNIVLVKGHKIPLGKTQKNELMRLLGIN